MRARAIQLIEENDRHKRYMPGEYLDEMNKNDIGLYITSGHATWLKDDGAKPQAKKARNAVKGTDEVEEE